MKPTVLITNDVPPDHLHPLLDIAQIIYGPRGGALMSRDAVMQHAPHVDAIINQAELRVDETLLACAVRLKVVANVASGVDNLDLAAMTRFGVWATNTPDSFADAVAEYTMALMLNVARALPRADRYVRSGQWARDGFQPGAWDGMLLAGKCLGIVGFGRGGRAVAQRAAAFGMRVIYYNRSSRPEPGARALDDLLADADIVSLHLPLTHETKHLIDRAALARMKRGSVLLNVARGKVLDEQALVDALASGHIAGAGLDVAEHEPHVNPALMECDNVVFSPHLGGASMESRAHARRTCAQNVALVLQGRQPKNPVNSPRDVNRMPADIL